MSEISQEMKDKIAALLASDESTTDAAAGIDPEKVKVTQPDPQVKTDGSWESLFEDEEEVQPYTQFLPDGTPVTFRNMEGMELAEMAAATELLEDRPAEGLQKFILAPSDGGQRLVDAGLTVRAIKRLFAAVREHYAEHNEK